MNTTKPETKRANGNATEAAPNESPLAGSPRIPQDGPVKFPLLPNPITVQPNLSEEFLRLPVEEIQRLAPLLQFFSLNTGCYLTRFTPTGVDYHYDGTIRVQRIGANTIASGDLYQHKPFKIWPVIKPFPVINKVPGGAVVPQSGASFFLGEPNPSNGIPIFSRSNYRYYLRITQILEFISTSKTFTLGFEMWKFNGVSVSPQWTKEGTFTAPMTFGAAPANYPAGADYLTGPVRNASNVVVGNLAMGWVSKYLRKATVEIDRVADAEAPLDSGAGHTWQSVFDQVGWQINTVTSNADVVEPSGDSWTDGEMHAAMLARRDSSNLDNEWRYHVLAVNRIDSTPRGIMYDNGGTDSNNVPREGIGISSHWMIPNTNDWGKVKGMRFGAAKAPYFRTALHEIGHAMGLYHNTVDFGIMNTTDVISAGAVPPVQFPDNVKWAHASDDQKRLQHMPDIYVRPGGLAFGTSYSTQPLSPDDEHEEAVGLELQVTAVQDVLPLGAPVRLEISLSNVSDTALPAPESLHMKYGCVSGRVVDSMGNVRTFNPLILCVDEVTLKYMEPGDHINDSLTLLRGAEGALFPSAGSYTVEVEVSWDLYGGHVGLSNQVNVFVTTAQTASHARAAMKVLNTPDTLLSLVLTGDHLTEGNAAIQAALADEVLRPHYAYIEAKRLAQPFRKRKANLAAAANLLDEDTVMNAAEVRKCTKLAKQAGASDSAAQDKMTSVLRAKVKSKAGTDAKAEKATDTLVAH